MLRTSAEKSLPQKNTARKVSPFDAYSAAKMIMTTAGLFFGTNCRLGGKVYAGNSEKDRKTMKNETFSRYQRRVIPPNLDFATKNGYATVIY